MQAHMFSTRLRSQNLFDILNAWFSKQSDKYFDLVTSFKSDWNGNRLWQIQISYLATYSAFMSWLFVRIKILKFTPITKNTLLAKIQANFQCLLENLSEFIDPSTVFGKKKSTKMKLVKWSLFIYVTWQKLSHTHM